ncbi:MAG: EutN/CcmL family microcompartment protein [Phycisphaerales bacterium]|nr:EutN/CcmL family microcompartment protein [Phycisphaerales bacterium]
MRIGEVIGRVTLNKCDPKMIAGRFLIVRPEDPESLRTAHQGTGEIVVAYDRMGAGLGQQVSVSEGREAACPFHPDRVAIDAYIAALLDSVTCD